MAGVPIYQCPAALEDFWWAPMQRMGLQIESHGARGVVRRARATVTVTFVGSNRFMLVFSSFLLWRSKSACLAEEVERVLLASGAKAYGKPISTNLVYQLDMQPNRDWLARVLSPGMDVRLAPLARPPHAAEEYPSGVVATGRQAVRFWTGPACDPATRQMVHFLALGADAAQLPLVASDSLLSTLTTVLSSNGGVRMEVELPLAALED